LVDQDPDVLPFVSLLFLSSFKSPVTFDAQTHDSLDGPVRAIANERSPFVKVNGNVQYSTISAKEAGKYYAGEIVFNNEEDIHEPRKSGLHEIGCITDGN
jgi:hypothetical protein